MTGVLVAGGIVGGSLFGSVLIGRGILALVKAGFAEQELFVLDNLLIGLALLAVGIFLTWKIYLPRWIRRKELLKGSQAAGDVKSHPEVEALLNQPTCFLGRTAQTLGTQFMELAK